MILPNNQSSATLWVRDTCLIVGLLPFIIILITASLSSKMRKQSAEVRKFFVCSNIIDTDQFEIISVGVLFRSGCWYVFLIAHCRTSFPGYLVGSRKKGILQ